MFYDKRFEILEPKLQDFWTWQNTCSIVLNNFQNFLEYLIFLISTVLLNKVFLPS